MTRRHSRAAPAGTGPDEDGKGARPTVSWSVRESEFRDQVEASEGRVRFASGVQQQDFVITMKNDAVSIP